MFYPIHFRLVLHLLNFYMEETVSPSYTTFCQNQLSFSSSSKDTVITLQQQEGTLFCTSSHVCINRPHNSPLFMHTYLDERLLVNTNKSVFQHKQVIPFQEKHIFTFGTIHFSIHWLLYGSSLLVGFQCYSSSAFPTSLTFPTCAQRFFKCILVCFLLCLLS